MQIAAVMVGFNQRDAGGTVQPPDLVNVALGTRSPVPLISSVGHDTDTTLIDVTAAPRAKRGGFNAPGVA